MSISLPADALTVVILVAGCLWPLSPRVGLNGTECFQLQKNEAIFDSPAEPMTYFMILYKVIMVPLFKSCVSLLGIEKCNAALLCDPGSKRWEKSEYKARIMLLVWNLTIVSGCEAHESRNCVTSVCNCCVAFDGCPAIELNVCAMVGSVAQEYHTYVLVMSCTCFTSLGERSEESSSGVGACICVP